MERGFAVICAVVLAFTSHVCHAGKWQISPLAGYTYGGAFEEEDTGTDLNIEESPSLALAIDAEYEPDSQIEFYVSRQATEFKADPDDDDETGLALFPAGETLFDLDVYYIHIGGTYMWQERVNDFQPYIVGTLGVTHFVPRNSDYDPATRPSISLGLGARYWITKHVGLRAESRGFATLFNGSGSVFSNSEGLSIRVRSDAIGQIVANAGVFFEF
ncbi:MAG TPA: hypothetical protein PLA83_01690 [Deltaproteobacteria bacterium]|jgi:hypothetical protein|nr:hypothetical protein [Deltaproteobacteria bacterium]HQH99753.1 hypothetical protein [Deltaproteobacteria bacterium]